VKRLCDRQSLSGGSLNSFSVRFGGTCATPSRSATSKSCCSSAAWKEISEVVEATLSVVLRTAERALSVLLTRSTLESTIAAPGPFLVDANIGGPCENVEVLAPAIGE
jgi:hypothetical protein